MKLSLDRFWSVRCWLGRAAPRAQSARLSGPRTLQTVPNGCSHDLPRFPKVLCASEAFCELLNDSVYNGAPAVQDGFDRFGRRKYRLRRVTPRVQRVALRPPRRLPTVSKRCLHILPRFLKVLRWPRASHGPSNASECYSEPTVQSGFD